MVKIQSIILVKIYIQIYNHNKDRYNSVNMDKNIQLKLKYKGKVFILSTNKNRTLEQVITNLRSKQSMLSSAPMYTMKIRNISTDEVLDWTTQLDCIRISDAGKREIQVFHDQDASKSNAVIDSVQYQIESDGFFVSCLKFVINDDSEAIKQLRSHRKMSEEMYQLLVRIQRKIGMQKPSGGQKQKEAKNDERVKQLQSKLQKTASMCKDLQSKLSVNKNVVNNLQTKLKSQSVTMDQNKKEIQKQNKILKQKNEQIKAIQTNLNKLAQDSPTNKLQANFEFADYQKLSPQSLNALKYLQQQMHTKIVSNNEHYQQLILQTHKSILESSEKKKDHALSSIMYKSKTYQSEIHHKCLSMHSQILRKFIQNQVGNQIKDIRSMFYMEKINASQFLENLKNKPNFVLLFTHGQTIFGIFSPEQMGPKKIRSQNGFLFNLSSHSMFKLKQKQSLWKQSNIQLKIGNDSLIMPEPIAKQNGLRMRKKKDMESAFQIKPEQINQIFENKNQIIIDSFEMLTVVFDNQKSVMVKSFSMTDSKVEQL